MATKKRRPTPKRRASRSLSEKERRFVEYFMGEAAGNATKAARLAGYRSPHPTGSRLLRKATVQAAIQQRVAADPAIATRQDRQHFWTEVMLGRGTNRKARMVDRLKASELLGRSQGDFVERHEHRFPKPPSLTVEVKK